MNETLGFDMAISALRLAVMDATEHPTVKFAQRNKVLATRAAEMATDDASTSLEDRNRTRLILLLNRAVTRYLSRTVPKTAVLGKDLNAVLHAAHQPGVNSADAAAVIEILSYFSEVAREYAIANPREWNTAESAPALEEIRELCAENAVKLARRSIAQKYAAEKLASSE